MNMEMHNAWTCVGYRTLHAWLYRRKMQARISELESAAEQAKGKSSKLEKDKSRMTMEIKDVTMQLDDVSHTAIRLGLNPGGN